MGNHRREAKTVLCLAGAHRQQLGRGGVVWGTCHGAHRSSGAAERPDDLGEVAVVVGLGRGMFRCGRGGERGGEW
jgi:hypothetical protein